MISDLKRQNELAKDLLATLEKIKAIWNELPNEDELNDFVEKSARIAADLNEAVCHWEHMPNEDELNDVVAR